MSENNTTEDNESKSSEASENQLGESTDKDNQNENGKEDKQIPDGENKNKASFSKTDDEKANKVGNDDDEKSENKTKDNQKETKDEEEKIKNRGEMNILLLSETGVGKSTFINAIANYLTHKSFETAQREKLRVLIPAKFQIDDKNGKKHKVSIGETDKNEFLSAGDSATQDVKSYIFPIGTQHRNIRIIDTPGMGDTRGPEQDNKNCDYILNYIGNFRELHAICCLFKPSNTRSTVYFQYCITEILSRLDKSASKNIVFVFTNTRGTNYGSGETHDILAKTLNDIQKKNNVQIPLDKNIFCFDNEAFRYLAAVKKNVKFNVGDKEKYRESWTKSFKEFWKLIKYIKNIEPHLVQSTNAINEARRMVNQLAQPLAEISDNIHDNIDALQKHQEKMTIENATLEDLKNQMFMPVIDLKVVALNQPTTICAELKCAEIYKVGEKNKWHYKQRCHEPCYLRNVQAETVDNPELYNCWAIDRPSGICRICSCSYRKHMHVYYETTTIESRIENSNASKNIGDTEKFLEDVKIHIANMMVKKTELEEEHDTIVTSCAKFTHFLQNNAITPFNDSYKEYIEYLLTREQNLGKMLTNKQSVVHLKNLLKKYEETKKLFDNTLKLSKESGEVVSGVTSKEILETIQNLYKLKHSGNKIKELYECQQSSRKREHQYTEYVHTSIPKSAKDTKTRGNNYIKNNGEYPYEYGQQYENQNREGIVRRILHDYFGVPLPKSSKKKQQPGYCNPQVEYFRNVKKIAGGTGFQGSEGNPYYGMNNPFLFGNSAQHGHFPNSGVPNPQLFGHPNQFYIDPNFQTHPYGETYSRQPNYNNSSTYMFGNGYIPGSPNYIPTERLRGPRDGYNIPTDKYNQATINQNNYPNNRPYCPQEHYAEEKVQTNVSSRRWEKPSSNQEFTTGYHNNIPADTGRPYQPQDRYTEKKLQRSDSSRRRENPSAHYEFAAGNHYNVPTGTPAHDPQVRYTEANLQRNNSSTRLENPYPHNNFATEDRNNISSERHNKPNNSQERYTDQKIQREDSSRRYDNSSPHGSVSDNNAVPSYDQTDRYDNRNERYDDRNGRYADRNGRCDDRNGRYDDRNGRYDDRNGRYDVRYDDRYGQYDEQYGRNDDRNRRYDDQYERYDDRNRRYDDQYRRYDDQYRRYDDQNRRYDDQNRRYDDQNRRYDDQHRHYDDQNRRYDDRNGRYDDRNGPYEDPIKRSEAYDNRAGHFSKPSSSENAPSNRSKGQYGEYTVSVTGCLQKQPSDVNNFGTNDNRNQYNVQKFEHDPNNGETNIDNGSSHSKDSQLEANASRNDFAQEQDGTKNKAQGGKPHKEVSKKGKIRTVKGSKINKLKINKKKTNKKNSNENLSDGWESIDE